MLALRSVQFCKSCLRVQENLLRRAVSTKIENYSRIIRNYDHPPRRSITTRQIPSFLTEDSLIDKVKKKFALLIYKSRLNVTTFLLYESIADKINYPLFFRELNLPNTFYSWFVITELHVWMLMARLIAEGEYGRYMRNHIVGVLWSDVHQRSKKLGPANPAGLRQQVRELSEQFQAAIIAYDEGLSSDDIILAGAIWRRVYQMQSTDVDNLEKVVKYIRKQVKMLHNLSRRDILEQRSINWEPFK